MKLKYIIGGIVGAAFVLIALFSFDSSKIEYADFKSAQHSGKVVQVIGSCDKSKPSEYNSEKNTFKFYMNDEKGNKSCILATGAKPNNFDSAPMVVIKGRYEGENFHATEILTKCPSKYEGQAEELKGKSIY